MRELDACGIGFVADVEGRSSRSVVQAALDGLACVKHRGALAADALTSDGCGLLSTIPAEIFGEGHGVAVLFARGDDPRPGVDEAVAAEGLELVEWRTPPTDDRVLGDLAARTRPTLVHAVFRSATGDTDETAAYRLRRRIERATYRDIAVRYLTADTHPDHDTICTFRRNNLEAIARAFVDVLELAQELKLLKLGTVSLDGTHIKASASKDKNVTYERAQQLRTQLRQDVNDLLQQAERADHVGSAAKLDGRPDLAVGEQQIGDEHEQADEQQHALRDHDDQRPQPGPEEVSHGCRSPPPAAPAPARSSRP